MGWRTSLWSRAGELQSGSELWIDAWLAEMSRFVPAAASMVNSNSQEAGGNNIVAVHHSTLRGVGIGNVAAVTVAEEGDYLRACHRK